MLCDDSLAYDLATALYNASMSNPDEHIGFMISDVARLMRTVFDRRVRRLGLTRAQWLALTRLHRRPGASQSELADMMEVEKATVGRLIRPTGGQGLGRAPVASRRSTRQSRLSDERGRAPAQAHLAHRRDHGRRRSGPALAARGRPAPQVARPRQVAAHWHGGGSSSGTCGQGSRSRGDRLQGKGGRAPSRRAG